MPLIYMDLVKFSHAHGAWITSETKNGQTNKNIKSVMDDNA